MDEFFINKRDRADDLYRVLQQQSLDELQRLAGEIWTDYNAHDPGVTLNEAVLYSLTEYDYRLHFGLPDYLSEEQSRFTPERFGLYSPVQVFPTVPVTPDDYRKLIIDSVEAVENVWIYPEAGKNGWYEILVELSPVVEIISRVSVEKKIRCIYNRNRNLGEGLRQVRFIERRLLTMVADIELEGNVDATELLAGIYWEAQQFFIQGISYRRVEDILATGAALDDILEGPELKSHVVRPDSLRPLCHTYLIPLLYKHLGSLDGVKTVYSLYFTDGERIFGDTIESVSVEKSYTVAIPSPETPVKVSLRVGKTPLLVSVDKITGLVYARHARLYGGHNTTRDMAPFMKYPESFYRAMFGHLSICEDLPDCYGVNSRGVAADEPERRKAQAAQLKGYLRLFDGLLEQELDELQKIPDLLDVDAKTPETGTLIKRQELLADFRDRIFGEDSNPALLREYNFYDEGRLGRLDRRRKFLRGIPQWGRNRFKGLDLSDMTPGNVPGIKAYVSALLGLEGGVERPVVNVFPLYNLKLVDDRRFYKELNGSLSHNFVIDAPLKEEETENIPVLERLCTESDFYDLKRVIPLLHYNLIFEGLFRGGVRADNFRIVNLWQEPDRLLVFHHCDGIWDEWVNLGRFRSRDDLIEAANCLHRFLVMLNRKSETLYVLEHHLLSPDGSFTVTVVFPGWSVRMADARFREGCEELVSTRLPAHLDVRFRWLSAIQMWKFEKAYYAWRKECAGGGARDETIRQLQEIIK